MASKIYVNFFQWFHKTFCIVLLQFRINQSILVHISANIYFFIFVFLYANSIFGTKNNVVFYLSLILLRLLLLVFYSCYHPCLKIFWSPDLKSWLAAPFMSVIEGGLPWNQKWKFYEFRWIDKGLESVLITILLWKNWLLLPYCWIQDHQCSGQLMGPKWSHGQPLKGRQVLFILKMAHLGMLGHLKHGACRT